MAYTTIDDPSAYFKVQKYTGTSSSTTITFDDTDTDMQPDMVWAKATAQTEAPCIYDSVRGTGKRLLTDRDTAENDEGSNGISAFNSDGFTTGEQGASGQNTYTYVAWCWKESATAGFDIVTYTGDGSTRTISHSLSAVPNLAIIRCRSDARSWVVTNTTLGWTGRAFLDATDAWGANSGEFNDTAPTSSVFTLGADYRTNKDTETYVAYLWKNVQGFFKTGTYIGNGNNDGPFVYTGFKPALITVKRTSGTGSWNVFDNKREGFNPDNSNLYWNTTSAEQTDSDRTNPIDFLSNGFKLRGTDTDVNGSGGTYIYMAWAEAPFVNSNGVPNNAE